MLEEIPINTISTNAISGPAGPNPDIQPLDLSLPNSAIGSPLNGDNSSSRTLRSIFKPSTGYHSSPSVQTIRHFNCTLSFSTGHYPKSTTRTGPSARYSVRDPNFTPRRTFCVRTNMLARSYSLPAPDPDSDPILVSTRRSLDSSTDPNNIQREETCPEPENNTSCGTLNSSTDGLPSQSSVDADSSELAANADADVDVDAGTGTGVNAEADTTDNNPSEAPSTGPNDSFDPTDASTDTDTFDRPSSRTTKAYPPNPRRRRYASAPPEQRSASRKRGEQANASRDGMPDINSTDSPYNHPEETTNSQNPTPSYPADWPTPIPVISIERNPMVRPAPQVFGMRPIQAPLQAPLLTHTYTSLNHPLPVPIHPIRTRSSLPILRTFRTCLS
eukprot:TRINITY_DN12211_c0_g1_i1.p1 TRINITY_DN12211_c0_g1~~TRINITY_DN12211_c0_g1_i1.p1  ORF type:complete len:388 (-),score=4.70 TRINITY_DN12211_c0_g1_i1:130-1293(-)